MTKRGMTNLDTLFREINAWWSFSQSPGDRLSSKMHLTSIGIPMLKIRRSHDRLIFNTGIPIPENDGLYI